MRLAYAEAKTDPTFYVPLARAAEAAGYASMTIPDSVASSSRTWECLSTPSFWTWQACIQTFIWTPLWPSLRSPNGTDFPNIPYRYQDAVTALVDLNLGDQWLRDVLFYNAKRMLSA